MQDDFQRKWKINTVNAISTAILAFIGVIGLILALAQFELRLAIAIVVFVIIGLLIIIRKIKRWVENGK